MFKKAKCINDLKSLLMKYLINFLKKPKITKKKDSIESFLEILRKFSLFMHLDQICLNLVLLPNQLEQKELEKKFQSL